MLTVEPITLDRLLERVERNINTDELHFAELNVNGVPLTVYQFNSHIKFGNNQMGIFTYKPLSKLDEEVHLEYIKQAITNRIAEYE